MRRCSTARSACAAALTREVGRRIGPYRLGVEVLDAPVALIAPPDEVKSAFDDVSREQTRIETKVNNANQEAESQEKAALSDRYRIQQETEAYVSGRKLLARREADNFLDRLGKYREGVVGNPDYLRQIWDEERGKLFAMLKENGQLGLLDDHVGQGRSRPEHDGAAAEEESVSSSSAGTGPLSSFPNSCSGTPSAKLPFRIQFRTRAKQEFRGMHSRTEFGNEGHERAKKLGAARRYCHSPCDLPMVGRASTLLGGGMTRVARPGLPGRAPHPTLRPARVRDGAAVLSLVYSQGSLPFPRPEEFG